MEFKQLLYEYQASVATHRAIVCEAQELDALLEAPLDMPEGTDLVGQLEVLTQRIESAKRALGITNRLPNPADKKKHRGRVMVFLNQLRGMFDRVIRQLQHESEQDDSVPTQADVVRPGVPRQAQSAPARSPAYRAA